MPSSQSGYLLGIGSNIEPHDNIKKIVTLLLKHYPQLTLSRVLSIPPIGMNSTRDFLNVVVFIETKDAEQDLKQICNSIEITLGRNRNDPDRKTKDRPADLDILTKFSFPLDAAIATHTITDEYFLYPLLDEVFAHLEGKPFEILQPGITFSINDLTFGQTATTINGNTSTCNKRVIK
ncbi:2-amino-4-hydroxy-6-hydroxymethyldihydropteridine diphosphokinase [Pseudomonadota bacterium]|nr:2-amino-4-hydroxy-6-hydroxymethyldihydropteridine diphosphokinase [Pseudomonadota bacterium]